MNFYANVARETIEITKKNEYTIQGEKITLFPEQGLARKVLIYRPEDVAKAVALLESDNRSNECQIIVDKLDSLTSAKINGEGKTLVLNFADAYVPGGLFLQGASTQEEALCRCSTLYASITSEEAKEMYNYNRSHKNAKGSDYILISPDVVVFRDKSCNLLRVPFYTAVITIPSPNLFGEAHSLYDPERSETMLHKIRNMLAVASVNGYDTIILGAWGCGAFGHDANDVAKHFHTILFEENYQRFFKKVVFSIYDPYNPYNYNGFASVFKK